MNVDKLRNDFEYHKSGRLVRTTSLPRSAKVYKSCGYIAKNGYRTLKYKDQNHSEHRLIWMLLYGSIPEGMQIDHINRVRSDNRIENLRLVTGAQNQSNRSVAKNNKTGITGVDFFYKSWRVRLGLNHIGMFDSFFDACCARKSEEIKHKMEIGL